MTDEIIHDKLTEQFMIRIPEITKTEIDKLSAEIKKRLNKELLVTMARVIHESKFNPTIYLKEE